LIGKHIESPIRAMLRHSAMLGQILLVSSLFYLAAAADIGQRSSTAASSCVSPGNCTAPATVHTVELAIKPRQQWNINGGFCGAVSLQVAALGYGAWISQDVVRKATPRGAGHGNPQVGYEVLPSNVAETARNLKLKHDEWDYMSTKPQAPAFKKWIKSHLVKMEPVVMFPICKGDSHTPYPDSNPNGGHFDHVEPIIGFGTNHGLDDAEVYDDDWLLHFSDQDLHPYYRHFNTLQDDTKMQGNCKNAQAGPGRNEMYPCIFDQVDYGLAVTGLNTTVSTLRIVLDVDRQDEPDVRFFQRPVSLYGTLRVFGLQKGSTYVLYRFKGIQALPSSKFDSGYEHKTTFGAQADSWLFADPSPMLSSGAYYYIAVPAPAGDTGFNTGGQKMIV